ncbi:isocitrate/isopropylmalate dehydrogenase family protein [Halorarum halophilum]|uniref:Isocitrate/isopropylmalate dehydrogenase family protein n=1 Tax=Halorarum halophilum TaxID=2743090 RepID=A0A7D5KF13_9EURY|nr:isocitrate/isopropylmalate dehydrogenase family protein [Halobaculum halophilum]QLG27276.1 isocitrate/isopropylmalate dehydrogenase family protein [Halobaculum halophilum]
MAHDIALLPGDGIGVEVVDAATPLLERAAETHDFEVETTRYEWGSDRFLDEGSLFPDDAMDRLADHDAILHGAMGDPRVPDYVTSIEGPIAIRQAFDLYVNYRPVRLHDAGNTPLKGYGRNDVDIAWFRENSEGEYVDIGGRLDRGGGSELAIQTSVYTEKGVERVVRAAFEAALDREGYLTNVTKSNALRYGPVFWDEVVEDVAESYPSVTLEHLLVDAASMDFVLRPDEFDVVVGPNLFGDILTDLTAAVTGGLGLAPSANVNPDGDAPGLYEPVHGSAPDIAGEGVANPIAAVLSGALMFEDLGEESAADALRDAVAAHLADDGAPHTPDLGGDGTTANVVADLRSRL